jgi:alanine racemase
MSELPKHNPTKLIGHRPTWAEIDLDSVATNYQVVRDRVGPKILVMAVVKANAYGHGSVSCARRLAAAGVDWFGVATPEEAIELRDAGVTKPILCLGGFWEGQASACIQQQLVPAVYRLEMVQALDDAARAAGVVADVHVKIDTGMGRLGVRFDEASDFAQALKRFSNIRVDGLMTQLAAADDHSCQPLTVNQVQRFAAVEELFRECGFTPTYRHLANSAGVFGQPSAWGNLVRPGGVLYGLRRDVLAPSPTADETLLLKSVMSLRSRIMMLKWVPAGETIGYGCTYEASRKTLVATLPIGYNDGYLRGLSSRGRAIVRGVFASVVGRVSMDLTLIDVTDVAGVETGDIVTLMGRDHDGSDLTITAEGVAKIAGTISYEVTCGIGSRVRRLYVPE